MTPPQLALWTDASPVVQPLPLQVAADYGFPLQYHMQDDDTIVYAVQDWIAGLSGETDAKKVSVIWRQFKNQSGISNTTLKLPYKARDGKSYQRDFATDTALYQFAAYARAMKDRPQIAQIKDFLAKAGAFVDELRQDPEAAQQSIANHRQAQAMKAGHSAAWVNARETGVMTRKELTALLVKVCPDYHVGQATNDIYRGTWGQDANGLRKTLGIGPKQNPRDHMGELALIYTMASEAAVRAYLSGYGDDDVVPTPVVRNVIGAIATQTGKQASDMAALVGIDLMTGKPLLTARS